MLKYEDEFGREGFLAVKTFAKAYLLSRSEWAQMDRARPVLASGIKPDVEVAM